MALDSNMESSIPDIDSEPSISSQSTSKAKPIQSNIWQYYHTLDETERRDEQGRLVYTCDTCNYRTITINNFHLHYKNAHSVNIKIYGGKTHYIERVEEELQDIITQIHGTELSDKILKEILDKQAVKIALIKLIII